MGLVDGPFKHLTYLYYVAEANRDSLADTVRLVFFTVLPMVTEWWSRDDGRSHPLFAMT
jgi:hypothetical protein